MVRFDCDILDDTQVAIKFERRIPKANSMLIREIRVMMEMKGEKGFPKIMTYGKN